MVFVGQQTCCAHAEKQKGRSMTAPLMERLDVEVEPLDSLFGIDAERLPEPADDFRDRGAELRMAWAAAADWPPSGRQSPDPSAWPLASGCPSERDDGPPAYSWRRDVSLRST